MKKLFAIVAVIGAFTFGMRQTPHRAEHSRSGSMSAKHSA